jgi:hypothetical protein
MESELKEVVKIAGAIIELARDEFAWMAVDQLLGCAANVQLGLRGTTETLRLGPIAGNLHTMLNQLLAQVQSAMQASASVTATLSSPKVPHELQQAFRVLQPAQLCSLVFTCCTTANELKLLVSTLSHENSQVVSIASSHCDKITGQLQSLHVLPEALSLDESSGCLTGTPKQIVTKCKYTLKAYN